MTETDHTPTHFLWQLKLARAYAQLYCGATTPWREGKPLVSEQYVMSLETRVWQYLCRAEESNKVALKTYMRAEEGVWSCGVDTLVMLAVLLMWSDIPPPGQLQLTPQCKVSRNRC